MKLGDAYDFEGVPCTVYKVNDHEAYVQRNEGMWEVDFKGRKLMTAVAHIPLGYWINPDPTLVIQL